MFRIFMGYKVIGLCTALVIAVFAFSSEAAAQTAAGASDRSADEEVAADSLACWWRADRGAVRIGEEFTVTLTCRSAESSRERTVLNEALLDPGAIALPPYQVKNGKRHRDVIRILPGPDGPVTLRSVQYAYTVKLLGEGFFGKDVPLPPLEIRYHIDLATNQQTVTPGKERTYLLPSLPMRIQSLVPRDTETIRDAGIETFGDSEGRRRQAIAAFMVAALLVILPIGVMLPVLIRAIRSRKPGISNGAVFRDRELLSRLAGELRQVEKMRRSAEWDGESVGRSLSVFRVACALALGRRVFQTPAAIADRGREGQLKFRRGLWRRTKVLVSASLTPEAMSGATAATDGRGAAAEARKELLAEALRAFAAFSDARYATAENASARDALDHALKTGFRLIRELRADRCPILRAACLFADRCARWSGTWKRS